MSFKEITTGRIISDSTYDNLGEPLREKLEDLMLALDGSGYDQYCLDYTFSAITQSETKNILFVGSPACGKTTVAKKLSKYRGNDNPPTYQVNLGNYIYQIHDHSGSFSADIVIVFGNIYQPQKNVEAEGAKVYFIDPCFEASPEKQIYNILFRIK